MDRPDRSQAILHDKPRSPANASRRDAPHDGSLLALQQDFSFARAASGLHAQKRVTAI